ncbi:hypothetical protein CEXT_406471 [Caerostris extrusa]|uniref:Uncharacterized protein n=1 Tax=Caerostris extrusa TaxID=172846 RepID=A0AAV4MZ50_CAEEX|nr:hypothetical protein CEXT_406471 [Caerostris extrusa]
MLIKPTLRSNSSHPRSCRVPRTKRVINRAHVYPERNLHPILSLMSGDFSVRWVYFQAISPTNELSLLGKPPFINNKRHAEAALSPFVGLGSTFEDIISCRGIICRVFIAPVWGLWSVVLDLWFLGLPSGMSWQTMNCIEARHPIGIGKGGGQYRKIKEANEFGGDTVRN